MNATQCSILGALIHDWQVDNGRAVEVRAVKYDVDTYLITLKGVFKNGDGHVGGAAALNSYYIASDGRVTEQT